MEEEKAAAYYDELTRKGERAARFKQGLGFSSLSDTAIDNGPARGSALPSSSAFLSNFVRASSPGKTEVFEKQAQLENIQNKLKKKQSSEHESRVSDHRSRDDSSRERDRHSRRTSTSRDGHDSRRRYRSPSRERDRDRRRERRRRSRSESYSDEQRIDRDRTSHRRRRSRSRSYSDEERRRPRGSREGKGRKRRSRSSSPRERRSEKNRNYGSKDRGESKNDNEKNDGINYSQLINGYAEMTAAERVKAKMKLQLKQAAEKDSAMGIGAGWERFEFNKDAPLDEEEIEVADDDKVLVKHIGQSFRFSAVEAKREEEIKAAHDEAMFGAPTAQPPVIADEVPSKETERKERNENTIIADLISDKVLTRQQGSWRDRARKLQTGPTS
ncbi:hypothetical protein NE237_023303 [Protea cynaroides]|uniref:Uncharacterized protein n=1 Tax=Protea cynaroides TaxID=273540 RepID=A0A9Q0K4B9_9MAGN|nr:hypothetical protein NE237_023303 [Protea cynaroides]